jgi:hypothetical protein
MELPVEPLKPKSSTSPQAAPPYWAGSPESLELWNEAYRRVESYFSALRVDNKLLLSSLVFKILDRAKVRFEEEPSVSPVEHAAAETDQRLVDWFRKVMADADAEPSDRLSARGRLALMMIESYVPWQQFFLNDEPLPAELATIMQTAYLRADPDFRFIEMRPRHIDLGIVDVANRTIESMGKFRVLAAWLLWGAFGSILALIFVLTR